MKTKDSLVLLLLAAFMVACNNKYQGSATTVVNEDGTCSRELTFQLDSAQLVSGVYNADESMLRWDKGWQLTWGIKGDSLRHAFPVGLKAYQALSRQCRKDGCSAADTIVVYAKSNFASVEEMAKATTFIVGSLHITPRITFKRTRGFFHTEYRYEEVYPQQRINWPIPMSKFFTKDEIGFWLSGTPDLVGGLNGIEIDDITQHLKTKYTQWLVANDFELTYQAILKNYSRIAAKAIDKQRFIALHDTLLREYSRETDLTAIYMDKSGWFKKFFHSDVYSEILDNDTLMREVDAAQRDFLALSMFNIDNKLTFLGADYPPTLSKLTGNRLMVGDVVISPSIIKKNLWAFALIGAVLILSLVLLVLMRKKR
jgi:hypothetical protein